MNRPGSLTLPILVLVLFSSCRETTRTPPTSEQRVVSLAPSLTEIVFAVGAGSNLVGRTTACDFPPEARAVPVVGDFGVPSMEKLAAVAPTIVLELALADNAVGTRMDRLGLNHRRIPCDRLSEIPPAIRNVGRLVDHADHADRLAGTIEEQISLMRADLPPAVKRPAVFVEVWHDPITTAGKDSFVADLVELAGGRNIGSAVSTPYYTVASEWVVAHDPDVILTLYMTPVSNAPSVTARAGWNAVAAVRHGRVYGGLNNDMILRPGPRVMEGVALLRQCLQPVQNR